MPWLLQWDLQDPSDKAYFVSINHVWVKHINWLPFVLKIPSAHIIWMFSSFGRRGHSVWGLTMGSPGSPACQLSHSPLSICIPLAVFWGLKPSYSLDQHPSLHATYYTPFKPQLRPPSSSSQDFMLSLKKACELPLHRQASLYKKCSG